MSFHPLSRPLQGIIPPMPTPLASDDQLDVAGVERLVEHLVGGGVHGVFALGSTGEGPSLSGTLQRELIDVVCREVAGRTLVLIGVSHPCPAESLALARHAAEAGADAAVVAPPFYFPLEQDEIESFAREFALASPLPVMLYNIPQLTKHAITPETIRRLLEIEKIVSFKDSSGDLDYFASVANVMRERPEMTALVGAESLMTRAMQLGGVGAVCGGGNLFPRLLVRLYETALAARENEVQQLEDIVNTLGPVFRVEGAPIGSVFKGIKTALAVLGICDDRMAPPLGQAIPQERTRVETILKQVQSQLQAVADEKN